MVYKGMFVYNEYTVDYECMRTRVHRAHVLTNTKVTITKDGKDIPEASLPKKDYNAIYERIMDEVYGDTY